MAFCLCGKDNNIPICPICELPLSQTKGVTNNQSHKFVEKFDSNETEPESRLVVPEKTRKC